VVKRENLIDQKSPPRFLIRACSVLVELETAQSRMIPIFEQAWRRKDYASLIPSNCKFCVPPGGVQFTIFSRKISPGTVFFGGDQHIRAWNGPVGDCRKAPVTRTRTARNQSTSTDSGSWILNESCSEKWPRFFLYYFAFQVNALIGLNSAKTSVTQPYFFFWASNTAFAVPLFTSRNCASPSRIA